MVIIRYSLKNTKGMKSTGFQFHYFLLITTVAITGSQCINFNEKLPVVSLKSGVVEGLWQTSLHGRKYASFEGIPYAKPPVGDLRFEEPQPVEPWLGSWKAVKSSKCIQSSIFVHGGEIIGEEDCLYLNVHVPETEEQNLDVLVHIHGGGFIVGYPEEFLSSNILMDKDWIFVAMNYRLGALGFLSTDDLIVPGNNGLKDQVLALKWIQDNIKQFGGNPNSVTLTGFSAGAASTHLHYLSPLSRGLFHRGMSISGTAVASWAVQDKPLENARKLASTLGCKTGNNKEMVDCLKQKPPSSIVVATEASQYAFNVTPLVPFAATVEQKHKNAFISELPYILLKKGEVLDVPWITSHTKDEGLLIAIIEKVFEPLEDDFSLIKYLLQIEHKIPEGQEANIISDIKKYYSSSIHDKSKFDGVMKVFTDKMMGVPAIQSAQLQAEVNKAPVYFYVFAYEGSSGHEGTNYIGTGHGDDMIYFFGARMNRKMTEDEIKLQDFCLNILHSYAQNGVLSTENITWEPVTKKLNYLHIRNLNEIKQETMTDFSVRDFWLGLGLKENEYFDRIKTEL